MSRLRRVPGSQKGHGPLVWGLGQQEAPGKQRMPHLSLWRHTCLPLGLNAEAGVWGSPMARRDQPLELGKRNTPQVRGGAWHTYTGLNESLYVHRRVMCVHIGTHIRTYSSEGCEHVYLQESHAHTRSQGGVCTHMFI